MPFGLILRNSNQFFTINQGLMEINRIVSEARSVKRPILSTEESSTDDHAYGKLPKIPRKLESLISDRRGQKKE